MSVTFLLPDGRSRDHDRFSHGSDVPCDCVSQAWNLCVLMLLAPKIWPWWETIDSKVGKGKIGTKRSNTRAKHQHKLAKNPNCERLEWTRVSAFGIQRLTHHTILVDTPHHFDGSRHETHPFILSVSVGAGRSTISNCKHMQCMPGSTQD